MFDRVYAPHSVGVPTSGGEQEDGVLPTVTGFDRESLALESGWVTSLVGHPGFGLTRLGLSLLSEYASERPVAYVDARGWLCPAAAWELGIAPEQLVVVRCGDPVRWAQVTATLMEGVPAIYAEVPKGVKEAQLRKLGALVRSRRISAVLRPINGDLPGGVAHLRIAAREIVWEGTEAGHGRLQRRRLIIEASGKVMRGMSHTFEVEDDGTDALRLVSGLAVATAGRIAG